MLFFLFIIILLCLIIYIIQNKLIIRIDTFFRKGFGKARDHYRSLLLHREAGRPVKPIQLLMPLNLFAKVKLLLLTLNLTIYMTLKILFMNLIFLIYIIF